MSCKDCKCGKKNVDLGTDAELRGAVRALRDEVEQIGKKINGNIRKEPVMNHRFDEDQDDVSWWKFWDYRSGGGGGLVAGGIIGSVLILFLLGLKLFGGVELS